MRPGPDRHRNETPHFPRAQKRSMAVFQVLGTNRFRSDTGLESETTEPAGERSRTGP